MCGDDDKKIIVSYVFMPGDAPVAGSSKNKFVVALSSCEADHIVTSLCTCKVV